MITIHRIIISDCNYNIHDKVDLEKFRKSLKEMMKASSVLFNTDESDSDCQKGVRS